jgi:hypothetical protein
MLHMVFITSKLHVPFDSQATMNFLTAFLLLFPMLVLGQGRNFRLFTKPGGEPVYVQPVDNTTGEPAYLALYPNHQPSGAVFTFYEGNVTNNGVNVYLSKLSKYETVFRVEVGAIPVPPLYVFYDTWSISPAQVLRASVWSSPPEDRQWFRCLNGGRLY